MNSFPQPSRAPGLSTPPPADVQDPPRRAEERTGHMRGRLAGHGTLVPRRAAAARRALRAPSSRRRTSRLRQQRWVGRGARARVRGAAGGGGAASGGAVAPARPGPSPARRLARRTSRPSRCAPRHPRRHARARPATCHCCRGVVTSEGASPYANQKQGALSDCRLLSSLSSKYQAMLPHAVTRPARPGSARGSIFQVVFAPGAGCWRETRRSCRPGSLRSPGGTCHGARR
jgi:hypothetical protein